MTGWKPTPRAWAELVGAVVLGVAALAIAIDTFLAWRRAGARVDAYHAYFRTAMPGQGGLQVVDDALDRAPNDPALLAVRGAIFATRVDDLDRALDVYQGLKKHDDREAAAWGRLGIALVQMELARRPSAAGTERRSALDAAERESLTAKKDLSRRLEPAALLAAIYLERGELPKAFEQIEIAERAPDPPSFGGLATLYAAKAEAYRRRAEPALEAAALERAVLLFPGYAGLRDRLARAVARRTIVAAAGPKPDESLAAVEDARRGLLPLHFLERHRKGPIYGFEVEHATLIREAIGVAEARLGKLDAARRTLAEAIKEAPKAISTVSLARNLAAVYARLYVQETNEGLKKGHARLASETLRDAAQASGVEPKDQYEWLLAAAVFARQAQQHESAVRLLDRAAKTVPAAADDPRLDRIYAVSYDDWNKPQQAIEAYRRAISKAPAEPISLAMEERLRLLEEKRRR